MPSKRQHLRPRLCTLQKGDNGYGFHLHGEKGKTGQFIRLVEPDSPAEASGLRAGDRLVFVNGDSVESESHQKVVSRIRATVGRLELIVVDQDTEQLLKKHKLKCLDTYVSEGLPLPFDDEDDEGEDVEEEEVEVKKELEVAVKEDSQCFEEEEVRKELEVVVKEDNLCFEEDGVKKELEVVVKEDNLCFEEDGVKKELEVVKEDNLCFEEEEVRKELEVVVKEDRQLFEEEEEEMRKELEVVKEDRQFFEKEEEVKKELEVGVKGDRHIFEEEEVKKELEVVATEEERRSVEEEAELDHEPRVVVKEDTVVVEEQGKVVDMRPKEEQEEQPETQREQTPVPDRNGDVHDSSEKKLSIKPEEVVRTELRPRLCVIKRGPNGYGFNLHSERARPGQYIRAVDEDSPAERAGLLPKDRIVEVNSVSVQGKTHSEVVAAIKAGGGVARLLVVDPDTDAHFKRCRVTPTSQHLTGPLPEPAVNGEADEKVNGRVIKEAERNSKLSVSPSPSNASSNASLTTPTAHTPPEGLVTDAIPALNLTLQQVKELTHQKRSNKRAPPMDWTKKNELFSNL